MRRPLSSYCKSVKPLTALLMAGCASAPAVMTYHPDGTAPQAELVWPASPETARLQYAGLLQGEANFSSGNSAERSAGARVFRWLVGLGQARDDVQELIRPQSGMVDDRGRIFVTDAGRSAVVVFDEQGAKLSIWDRATAVDRFVTPVGIAGGHNGEILVADADLGFIARLDASGEPAGTVGRGLLSRPTGIATDEASGRLYVADTGDHNVKVFSNAGELINTIGKRGTAPGEFNGPTHMSIDTDNLYVADTLNARVQVLALDGTPVGDIGQRGLFVGNLVRPKGVTFDQDGNVYVIESYFDHLLIFDQSGQLLLPVGGTGAAIGQFFLPAGIWSDASNRIFVADMFNGRIVIFQYLGG